MNEEAAVKYIGPEPEVTMCVGFGGRVWIQIKRGETKSVPRQDAESLVRSGNFEAVEARVVKK